MAIISAAAQQLMESQLGFAPRACILALSRLKTFRVGLRGEQLVDDGNLKQR